MSSLTYKNSDALWHGRFIGWHFTPQMFPSNFGRYGQWLGPFATDFQWNSQPVHSKYPRKMRQPVQGSEFLDHAMSPCPHVLPTYYMLPTVNPFVVLIIGVDQRKKTPANPGNWNAKFWRQRLLQNLRHLRLELHRIKSCQRLTGCKEKHVHCRRALRCGLGRFLFCIYIYMWDLNFKI